MLDTGSFAGEAFVSSFGGFVEEDSTACTSPSHKWETILPFHNCTSLMASLVWLLKFWRIPLDVACKICN
jgi:hypothetical protein